jgi:hypothetical protein
MEFFIATFPADLPFIKQMKNRTLWCLRWPYLWRFRRSCQADKDNHAISAGVARRIA